MTELARDVVQLLDATITSAEATIRLDDLPVVVLTTSYEAADRFCHARPRNTLMRCCGLSGV